MSLKTFKNLSKTLLVALITWPPACMQFLCLCLPRRFIHNHEWWVENIDYEMVFLFFSLNSNDSHVANDISDGILCTTGTSSCCQSICTSTFLGMVNWPVNDGRRWHEENLDLGRHPGLSPSRCQFSQSHPAFDEYLFEWWRGPV